METVAVLVNLEDLKHLEALKENLDVSIVQRKAALDRAIAFQQRILAERGGVPFSGVAEDINRLREESMSAVDSGG